MKSPVRSTLPSLSGPGFVWVLSMGMQCFGASAAVEQYEVGGPLAGVKIQADEPTSYGAGYQYGRDLYPGSVEHYRHYWHKYMPTRPFFDRQSQLKNFLAKDLVTPGSSSLSSYAEPIYQYSSKSGSWLNTEKPREPVPVVRARIRSPVFKLDLGEL